MRLTLNSTYPTPPPTPLTGLDASIEKFQEFQHSVGCGEGEGELQDTSKKVALLYKSTNSVSLSQRVLSRIVLAYACFVS